MISATRIVRRGKVTDVFRRKRRPTWHAPIVLRVLEPAASNVLPFWRGIAALEFSEARRRRA